MLESQTASCIVDIAPIIADCDADKLPQHPCTAIPSDDMESLHNKPHRAELDEVETFSLESATSPGTATDLNQLDWRSIPTHPQSEMD